MPVEFRAPADGPDALPPLNAVSAEPRAWLAASATPRLGYADAPAARGEPAARWPSGGLAALAEDHALRAWVAPRLWVTTETAIPPSAALAFLGAARPRTRASSPSARRRDGVRASTIPSHGRKMVSRRRRANSSRLAGDRGLAGGAGSALQLWGVDWPVFRGRLLDALATCHPGHWYLLDTLLARLTQVRPSLLGEEFTAASAVGQAPPDRARSFAPV